MLSGKFSRRYIGTVAEEGIKNLQNEFSIPFTRRINNTKNNLINMGRRRSSYSRQQTEVEQPVLGQPGGNKKRKRRKSKQTKRKSKDKRHTKRHNKRTKKRTKRTKSKK